MGITREIHPDLEPIEFPDDMDEVAVDAYVAQNGQALRQKLITRRQAQLAAETEGDEALGYRMGQVPLAERVGSTLMAAPQAAARQTGQTLRGLGEFLANSSIPSDPFEADATIAEENIRRFRRTPQQVEQEVEDVPIRQAGTRMVAAAPETFPTLPGVRDSLPSQVSSGVGSVAALMPAGLTGPAAPFVAGGMYGLSAGEDFADDAERVINGRIAEALAQGDTATAADLERRKFDMKNTARTAGRVIGASTEGLLGVAGKIRVGKASVGGIGERLAERLIPGAQTALKARARNAIEGAITESTQEATEQLLGNAAARAVYDPNRKITEDVLQSALVGGLTGGAVAAPFRGRRDGGSTDPLPASREAATRPGPAPVVPEDINAPDLTIDDVGDMFGGVPEVAVETPVPDRVEPVAEVDPNRVEQAVAEVPATETRPAEAVAAGVVETPVPEQAAAPVAEPVVAEKPKRTRKPKASNDPEAEKIIADLDKLDDEQMLVAAMRIPEPMGTRVRRVLRERNNKSIRELNARRQEAVAPNGGNLPAPQLTPEVSAESATRATIPPDDTAMEAATAAAMAGRTPAPVTTAPDEGIAERAAADAEMTRATARVPEAATVATGAPEEGMVGVRTAQPNPEPEAQSLTPKQYHKAINAWRAKEYGVPVSEVEENYPEESNKQDHWSAVNKFVERGGKLDAKILDSLDEEQIQYLQRSARASVPEGYLSPVVRAKNKAFEREMIDARKRGREEAKREVPAVSAKETGGVKISDNESSKGKHFVRVVQNDGIVDLHVFDSEDQAGLFHGQLRAFGGVKKIGRAKGNSKTPLSKFVEQSKATGSVNVIRHDKPKVSVTSATTPEPTITSTQATQNDSQQDDSTYANAVRRGDMETAQRMVDKAAKKAWPNNRLVDQKGNPIRLYHGTAKGNKFTVFKPSGTGLLGAGVYLSQDKNYAAEAGPEIMEVYANISSPKDGETGSPAGGGPLAEVAIRKPQNIKSADPVVYDDTGSIVPLSKRFDPSSNDIRGNVASSKPPIAPSAEPPAAQAAEIQTPESRKQSLPPMAPKAQKAFLLEKIDEALEQAPDPESRWAELADKWNNSPEKEEAVKSAPKGKEYPYIQAAEKAFMDAQPPAPVYDPFIIIEVPGDGTFKINNTKRALKAFKERANKFPTGKASTSAPSTPSQNQSKPVSVGKDTRESFLASAKEFVSDDPDRQTIQFIMSDGKRSAATDGRVMLIWNKPLGGTANQQALFDTNGKPVEKKDTWNIPAWQQVSPKTSTVLFKKLNTDRLFNMVKQATAGPSVINVGKNAKTEQVVNNIRIVKNLDGSIGLFGNSQFGEYVHNVQKGAERIAALNPDLFMSIIQASRRMGSETVSLSIDESQSGKPVIVKWDGAEAVLMPMKEDGVKAPKGFTDLLSGKPQPDIIQRALDAAIKATDRGTATYSDPFLIAAVGLPTLNAALRLVRRVYLKTRDLVRAKRQGMRLIRRQLRTDPKADVPKIEAAFNRLVDDGGLQEGAQPGQIESFQASDGSRRQKSRGLFKGDVTVDTDAEWQAGAERWIAQFNGNIRRAFEAARSTDYATTGLNPAAQDYVFGRLLEMSEIAVNSARNDVDAMRALNLQKEITDASRLASSEAGKALGARALVQNRLLWMFPVLNYRNLIREAQKRLPFPDVVADEVRAWLQKSGQQAVQEMRNAMTDADKVFARELKTTVRDMRVVWRDVMTASVESQEASRRKILEELVKSPELNGLSRQGYIDIANLLGKAWEKERARIFAAEFRKQVPLPSVKEDVRRKLFTAIPDILKWANLGLLDNEAFRNAVAPKFGVAKFDGETAKKLNEMAQRAQKVGGSNRKAIIEDMYRLMQTDGGVRWQDLLRDYWFAAVLTALDTQVDNVMGIINGQMLTAMGMAMAKPEVRRMMGKAYTDGFYEGVKDFWPILTNGSFARSINFNQEQPNNTLEAVHASKNRFIRMLGVAKYTGRFMEAINNINALSANQAATVWALSNRYPIEHVQRYMMPSEKVRQAAIAKAQAENTPANLMNKRVREIIQESIPIEVLLSAKEISDISGYTNQPTGVMGSLYRALGDAEKRLTGFKFLTGTQFARFATNLFNQSLNFVAPVALARYWASSPGRQDSPYGLKFGEEHRKLILAQAAFGSALATFAAALFLGDDDDEKDRFIDINGSFKSLPDSKRKQLLSEGRLPYSIRIGNKYVSYRQLPFGAVLSAIGELRDRQLFQKDKWDQESIIRKFGDGMAAGVMTIKDAPAIASFTEFLGVANAYKFDPSEQIEKSYPRYLAKLAGSFIPRALKQVDAWADPSIYKANTGHEFFVQQMPFGRRTLGEGPVLNVLGEPVQVERYPWSRWIRTRKEDKAWSTLGELASKGVFLPVPAATVTVLENGKRREMTPRESYQYQQRVGKAYRKFVEENSEQLLRMKPDEAIKFIEKRTEEIRKRARLT